MILRSLLFLTVLSALLSRLQVHAGPSITSGCLTGIDKELKPKLSSKASIVYYTSAVPRWSDYHAPRPGVVVNVATENDIVETLKYCIKNNVDFLVQSGGHGWATTFNIDQKDLIINMRGLNKVTVSNTKDTITFEGGALVGEVLQGSYLGGVEAAIPTCNCVGMSGAALGGGLNRLIGQYGLVIDNILSINFVTSDAKLITVSPTSYPDLWWALRGAGANFGIVTSVTMKAYTPINNGFGWIGTLIFTPDKLEQLVQTLSDFKYTKEMFTWLFFQPIPPTFTPGIIVSAWYTGSEAAGKAAYQALYDIGPVAQDSQVVPYIAFNSAFGEQCDTGSRRPAYTAGLKKLDPTAFNQIWNEYLAFITQNPALSQLAIAVEAYSPVKIRQVPASSASFPHRSVNFEALITFLYEDASLDPLAEAFGERVRELWEESSGFRDLKAYVNYGHGDESLNAIYGDSLPRLKNLKKIWDKNHRFSQFFPIP